MGRTCAGCAGPPDRRAFLRNAATTVAALVVGLGAAPSELAALPVRSTPGRRTSRGRLIYPVPAADGVMIDKPNEVILVRWQAALYAFALSCPHQRTMLKWREKDRRFQCPKHKSKYQPDGSFVEGRATRGMDRYPLRLAGEGVVVDTAVSIREDEDPVAWNGAVVQVR